MSNQSPSSGATDRSPASSTRCCSRPAANRSRLVRSDDQRADSRRPAPSPAARHRAVHGRGVRPGLRGLRRRRLRRRRRTRRQHRAQAHRRPRGLAQVDRGRPRSRHHAVRAGLGDRRGRAAARRHLPRLEGVRRGEARRRRGATAQRAGLDDPASRAAHRRPRHRPGRPRPGRRTRRDPARRRRRDHRRRPRRRPDRREAVDLVGGQIPLAEAVSAAVDNG